MSGSRTPGPWELESDEQTGRAVYVTTRTGELDHAIATVDTPANAKLIAAAPELAEVMADVNARLVLMYQNAAIPHHVWVELVRITGRLDAALVKEGL